MKINIEAEAKEIAALVAALQERRDDVLFANLRPCGSAGSGNVGVVNGISRQYTGGEGRGGSNYDCPSEQMCPGINILGGATLKTSEDNYRRWLSYAQNEVSKWQTAK